MLARGGGGGAKSEIRQYPVLVLIRAVQMSYLMKDAGDLESMVRLASGFAMGADEHSDFLAQLDEGKLSIPKKTCVYKMRTKMDWMMMLYQRVLFSKSDGSGQEWVSHFCSDSSPQGGFEYFCSVEDRFIFNADPEAVCRIMNEDDGFQKFCSWQRRTLPVTVLGAGCQSVGAKLNKFMHVLLLETGSENMSDRLGTCCSWLADQGVELSIGDAPHPGADISTWSARLRREGDQWWSSLRNAFVFPAAMATADSLHATFNALEDRCHVFVLRFVWGVGGRGGPFSLCLGDCMSLDGLRCFSWSSSMAPAPPPVVCSGGATVGL